MSARYPILLDRAQPLFSRDSAGQDSLVVETINEIVPASAQFTRPATTPTYASGQLIANAGTAVPMVFAVSRVADKGFMIRRCRVKKTNLLLTGAVFRLHLYKQKPTPSNNDTGVWLTDEKEYLGSFDITMDRVFTDFAKGFGIPSVGNEIAGTPDATTGNIYGLLEARGAYVGGNAEIFTITLEVLQD